MAEPPRLSGIRLPWENSIIYFVTICVKDRRRVLATPAVFEAIKTAVPQLQKWHVLAGVIMPDHVHWVVSPVEDRELSVGDFSQGFKRTLRKQLGPQSWEWQRRCFDRLLRHGFVNAAEDWPYYLDYINETPDRGKLSASPTVQGCWSTISREGSE
jgi:REP element-mobilizing transposase RayT